MNIVQPTVTLLHCTPDPEILIERAGRVCWKSEPRACPGSHVAFIRMLRGKNHASVLEHASAGFLIGCDRGVSHELVRHRIASYSQTSTRYVRYSDGITVVEPSELSPVQYEAWRTGCLAAEKAYRDLLASGASPQFARSVLPTCLHTEVVTTMNFRSWRNFLELRLSPAAHPDIRRVARMIRDELVKVAPTVFEDFL